MTLFSKNHPVLVFLALSGCFLLLPEHFVHAGVLFDWASNKLGDVVKALLYGVFWLFSIFVSIAAALFVWVIDTKTFSSLMNVEAIYTVWRTVRDFCNIFFILVLLFSAFATIFQIERYEWKKTIPMLVIMALLVNFSFPISRFVIDLANVPMYFFAQNSVGESGKITSINESLLSASNIRKIILPGAETPTTSSSDYQLVHLLAATICMFLYGVSFLVLAVLLLIRMIALVILVMFSPIGFVGLITPALHKFASDWWDKLFKWAFYGPIAVMLLLVAIIVMKAADTVNKANAMTPITGDSVSSDFLASVAFLTIPIVLFWIAITQAEKYSNDMSSLGIKFGSNMGRKVGGWVRKGAWGAAMYIPKQTGVAGGIKQAWQDRMSGFKDSREKRERAVAGVFGGDRARARVDQENKKLTDEVAKKMDMANLGDKKLREIMKNGNKYEKAAALTELAERGTADRKDLANIRNIFGKDSQVTRGFEAKMRAFDPVAVFTEKIDSLTGTLTGPVNADSLENFVKSNRFDPKKLLSGSLTPELLQYAFKAKNISNKDLDELRAKGSEYVGAIEKSLDTMIVEINTKQGGVWDMKDDVQRNMQMAHLAQTGNFHSSVSGDDAIKAALFEKADGETLKRIKSATLTSGNNMDLFVNNVRGKYTEIISKMAETGVEGLANAKAIKSHVDSVGIVGGPPIGGIRNVDRLKNLNNDHRIRYI